MRRRLMPCVLLMAGWLTGCGDAGRSVGSQVGGGRLEVTIAWPSGGRLMPAATQSVRVQIRSGATALQSQTVDRPNGATSSTVSFVDLPVGTLTVEAEAYPEAAAGGTAMAHGSAAVAVEDGKSAAFAVTMASTIGRVEVTGTAPAVGDTSQYSATAYDDVGAVVLLTASALTWSSSVPSVATVDAAGVVTAVGPGVAVLTATDAESGVSGSASVRPTTDSQPAVILDGTVAQVGELDSFTFTGAEGDLVYITAYSPANAIDLHLRLLSPTSQLLASANTWYERAEITWRALPATGRYRFTVGDYDNDDTGDYRVLFFLRDGSLTSASHPSGGTLADESPVSGALALGDMAVYRFDGVAGDRVTMVLTSTSGASWDPTVRVYGGDGALVGSANEWDGGTCTISSAAIKLTGPQLVVVEDGTDAWGEPVEAGTFSLTMHPY